MKKILLSLFLIIMIPFVILLVAYLGLAYYYQDSFSYGTWINGVYATGKTIDEIDNELQKNDQSPSISVRFWDDTTLREEELDLVNIKVSISFKEPLQMIKSSMTPLLWGENLLGKKNRTVLPIRTFDLKSAEEEVETFLRETIAINQKKKNGIFLTKTENGYQLEDSTKYILDSVKAKQFLLEALAAGETEIDLTQKPCYDDLEITREMEDTIDLWKKVKDFQDFHFSYQFGEEKEVISEAIVCEWIQVEENGNFVFDQEGNLVLDEEKLKEYILYLASKYDTLNGTRTFKAARGDTVTIEGGTYGNKLNQKKEFAYLKDAFLANRMEENRIPEYESKAWHQGSNDIGDTFIEIDMTNQQMYYYKNGKTVIETPIVTGNMARKMDTPARTCFVYAKQKNRILRGPGYASHVNFWMPVNRGIGIHDAKWRKDFGGDIYKTEGSHGCINTPFDVMTELFEMVEVGTPVVMYY